MKRDLRSSFINTLVEIRRHNDNLVVLVSDSTSTSKIRPFQEEFPESVINIGIAEQNLIGMAAGLSLGGLIPVTANAAPFLLGRSNEQVKIDVCYTQTNVKLAGLNSGFTYGSLGPSHHCLDDISTVLSLGNIEIFAPCDPFETALVTRYAINKEGPVYIRLDSISAENIHGKEYKFFPGEPVIFKEGTDITIIALGTIVHDTLAAADELSKKNISAEVIGLSSIRPLNREKIIGSLRKTGCVLTVEEHSVHGGIGSLIGDIILENELPCKIKKLGVPAGQFAPASPSHAIKKQYTLDMEGIKQQAIELLRKRE